MSFYVSIFLFFHGVTFFPLVYSLAFSFQPDSASGGFVYVYRQQQCLMKKNRFFIFLFKLVPIQQKITWNEPLTHQQTTIHWFFSISSASSNHYYANFSFHSTNKQQKRGSQQNQFKLNGIAEKKSRHKTSKYEHFFQTYFFPLF